MTSEPAAAPAPAPHPVAAAHGKGWGVASGLLAAGIWGAYLALARAGVKAGLGATDLTFVRYIVAGLVMLPWFVVYRPLRNPGWTWWRVAVLTVLAGPPFLLVVITGYRFAPLVHGTLVQPPVNVTTSLLLSALLFGERLGPARLIGVATMFAGMLFAGWHESSGSAGSLWAGDLLFALGAAMWALFGVLQRKWLRRPMETTAVVSVFSMIAWVPVYLIFIGTDRLFAAQPSMLLLQVLVLGLGSGVIAVIAFTKAVHDLGPGSAGLFTVLVPGIANLVGIPLTHELPTLQEWSGLALSAIGLMVALRFAGARNKRPVQ